jgi:hypothetical protein
VQRDGQAIQRERIEEQKRYAADREADRRAKEAERKDAAKSGNAAQIRRGFPGAKPEKFCFWVFEGLNLVPSDDFHDLFLGSGAVSCAWDKWCGKRPTSSQLELDGIRSEAA